MNNIIQEVANKLEVDEKTVLAVVAEFALQLHRRAREYKGGNGDFVGESLWSQIDPQAFFHLLGFLEYIAKHYSWEPGTAAQYLARLPMGWERYEAQMGDWKTDGK